MPFTSPIARERFSGTDTSDIDGRTPDGGGDASLAVGEWLKHPVANGGGGTLGIGNDLLATRKVGLAYGAYADYPLTAIPSLPAAHRSEVTVVWPRLDADDPGGPLYCAFYGSQLRPGDPNPSTTPRSAGHSTVTVFMEWVGGSGSATVDATLSDGTHAVVEITITAGGLITQYISFVQFWGDAVTHREEGAPGVTYTAPKKCIQIGVDCNTSLVDKFGPCASTVTSRPSDVTISSYTYSVSGGLELDNVQGTAPLGEDAAFENAWVDATLRHDPAVETCYQATAEFDHSDVTPTVEYTLWYVSAGTFREMRSIAPAAWDHDIPHTHSLGIDVNNVLRVYRDNDELTALTFDLNTDVADADGLSVPILTTGDPAVDVSDFSGTGSWMELLEFTVYTGTPCEGDDDNPFPWDPPPVPDPIPPLIYVMQQGQWRPTDLPMPTAASIQVQQKGAHRTAVGGAVMAKGQWRFPAGIEDTDPPPNTDLPPYHDPCELLPPGGIPPIEPVGPPPARIFFAWAHPITQLGPLFTGAMNAMGSHTPGNISQAAARDSVIIGAQGGYDKFLNPNYNSALMDTWIASHSGYMGSVLASQSAGDFYGISVMDDFVSTTRWPPSGISVSEISRIISRWKTLYPGIRIGCRARAAQWTSSNYPANLDFIIAQYRYWGGMGSPAQFRDTELSLTQARGWDILWSINIENGGLGGSGISHRVMWEMTPAEVLGAWLTFIDLPVSQQTNVHGMGLWQFSSAVFGRAGMLDAFAIGRNALYALGPP